MATMAEPRIEAGTSALGNIGIYHFVRGDGSDDNPEVHYFEVRMGNHTVATKDTLKEAEKVAKALETDG